MRYAIERGRWAEAAAVGPIQSNFQAAESIVYFGRAVGAARSGDLTSARKDIDKLQSLHDALEQAKNKYWAEQTEIQRRAAAAWVARAEGKKDAALALMRSSSDLEDASEKHIAMENRLVPMRELLSEMLLELNEPGAALTAFETSLKAAPNRFRSYHGAARAVTRAGDGGKARIYYEKLVLLTEHADTERPEIAEAKAALGKK